jgi:hypothetical protein
MDMGVGGLDYRCILMMLLRDAAYMYRIRLLTDRAISWRKSFDVIMLWEFASAISPSVVGGTAVALFILNKEGVNTGKSTAIVFITALLDELFYVIIVPLVILFVGTASLFPVAMEMDLFGTTLGTAGIFITAYTVLALYSLLLIYGIFFNPKGFKWLIIKLFSLPLLRKWHDWADRTGDEMVIASAEFKGRSLGFWLKAYGCHGAQLDGPILGGQLHHPCLYSRWRTHAHLRPPIGDVEHSAANTHTGRQRLCGVCIQRVLSRFHPSWAGGIAGVALAAHQLLSLSVHRHGGVATVVEAGLYSEAPSLMRVLRSLPYVKAQTISDERTLLVDEIQEAVENLKLVRAGKLKARPAKDLLNEL